MFVMTRLRIITPPKSSCEKRLVSKKSLCRTIGRLKAATTLGGCFGRAFSPPGTEPGREKCRPVCVVLNPRGALRIPSPMPEECYSKVTYRTVHIALTAQPEALKCPAVIIQQYRGRFHPPPARHIRIHNLSQIPHAPTLRSLHRTLELMMMERI